MISNRIRNDYFNWIYEMMCDGLDESYYKLFDYLYNCQFVWTIPEDASRAIDGKNFRYQFGYLYSISRSTIDETFGNSPCSVLEMLAALAYRCEDTIMSNTKLGDRTAQWFWSMLSSIGISNQTDEVFNASLVGHKIYIFLNRTYKKNGKGGAFTIHDKSKDMRRVDLWYQMCYYLNELDGD